MADSQHTIPRTLDGKARPQSRRALIASGSMAIAAVGFADASTIANFPDETVAQCQRWLALEAEAEKLWDEWAGLEAKLAADHSNFFKLSETAQRQLPGGGARLLEIEQIAARLAPLRDALLPILPRLKARAPDAVIAKLMVASRLIIPDEHPEASRIVRDSVKDLRRLHKLKA